jgi:hypothetical protein
MFYFIFLQNQEKAKKFIQIEILESKLTLIKNYGILLFSMNLESWWRVFEGPF